MREKTFILDSIMALLYDMDIESLQKTLDVLREERSIAYGSKEPNRRTVTRDNRQKGA